MQPKEIVDYYILSGRSTEELIQKVQMAIHVGWQPYGLPYITLSGGHCQAMVVYANLIRVNEDGELKWVQADYYPIDNDNPPHDFSQL